MPRVTLTPKKREARNNRMTTMLNSGLPVAYVAEHFDLSLRTIYDFCNEHDLPTNPPVEPESSIEDQILVGSFLLTPEEMVHAFSIAAPMLKKIVARARKRWLTYLTQ